MEAYWRNQPITATANHTSSLVGDLFTQALNLPIGQDGKNSLVFVFAVGYREPVSLTSFSRSLLGLVCAIRRLVPAQVSRV